jgi:DNA-binding transcriptional LysR family regulator
MLVRPFNQPVRGPKAFYLVRPAMQQRTRKVEVFRDWLLDAVRRERPIEHIGQPLTI